MLMQSWNWWWSTLAVQRLDGNDSGVEVHKDRAEKWQKIIGPGPDFR